MKKLNIIGVFMLTALTACSGTGPAFNSNISSPASIASGKARVVLFRADGLVGAMRSIPVKMDGQDIAALPRASFKPVDIAPGKHDLSAEATLWAGSAHLSVQFAPDSIHYVEASYSTDAIIGGIISPAVGQAASSAETGLYRLNEIEPSVAVSQLVGLKEAQ